MRPPTGVSELTYYCGPAGRDLDDEPRQVELQAVNHGLTDDPDDDGYCLVNEEHILVCPAMRSAIAVDRTADGWRQRYQHSLAALAHDAKHAPTECTLCGIMADTRADRHSTCGIVSTSRQRHYRRPQGERGAGGRQHRQMTTRNVPNDVMEHLLDGIVMDAAYTALQSWEPGDVLHPGDPFGRVLSWMWKEDKGTALLLVSRLLGAFIRMGERGESVTLADVVDGLPFAVIAV